MKDRKGGQCLVPVHCRYNNPPHQELHIAAAEQLKITEMRLRKLVAGHDASTASVQAQEQVARRTGQLRTHLGGPLAISLQSAVLHL